MVIKCRFCSKSWIIAGHRNQFMKGTCTHDKCRLAGLLELAIWDMVSKEEANEINRSLGGA